MALSRFDASQCIRQAFDETETALKMVPSSTTSFEIELDADDGDSVLSQPRAVDTTNLLSAADASTNQTTSDVNILNMKGYAVAVVWASLDAADATVQLQASLDGTNYFDLSGESVTLSTASGTHIFNVSDAYYKIFRAVYTSNTVGAGTISIDYTAKG